MKIEKCPVCLGNGLVPNGFYGSTQQIDGCLTWSSSSTEFETCRACDGKGYVVIEDSVEKARLRMADIERRTIKGVT